MKKVLWLSLGLFINVQLLFASPTMGYAKQPAGTVSSLPITFTVHNSAPIPQGICSPTLTAVNEQATCTGLPICKGESTKIASFTCGVITTCGTTVPGGGDCTVSVTAVNKPSTMPAATPFVFKLSYGSYNSILASNSFTINGTNPHPPASSYRKITFKNSCTSTIWFGSITDVAPAKNILSGEAINCDSGGTPGKQACIAAGGACYSQIDKPDACFSQTCSSDSDCMTGAACHAATGKCFWSNPVPANKSFELITGSTNTFKIPEYKSNDIGIVWSGSFGGRTGCTTGACASGLCTSGGDNPQGVCSLGVGFQQPVTQAEPTFITYPTRTTAVTPADAYSVTTIHGANVPIAMYPGKPPYFAPSSGNPFSCGAPGINVQVPSAGSSSNVIGPSSWKVSTNQPDVSFRHVVTSSTSATRCTTNSDCKAKETCGLSYSSQSIGSTAKPGSGYLVCGTFAGWLTAAQICRTNSNFTTTLDKNGATVKNFACNSPVTLGNMSNLYQCNGGYDNSCYAIGATADCCGCADWGKNNNITPVLPVPTNLSYVAACQAKNDSWTGSFSGANQPQVYDTVYFLKKACPSCYVYPFDDASSSFTCTTGTTTTNNTKEYTVEFCPGGNGSTDFQPT